MYKDFKKSDSLDTGFVGGSGIIWMFSGIILGLLVGLGMYYATNKTSSLSMVNSVQDKIKRAQNLKTKPIANNSLRSNQQGKQAKGLEQEKPRQTKFSYYAVLPTLDVPVGADKPIDTSLDMINDGSPTSRNNSDATLLAAIEKEKVIASRENIKTKQKSRAVKSGNYLLQVASYKIKSRAKVTRGRLTKNGIDAYIKSKKIKGRTWYRVVAGPVDQNSIGSWKHKAEKMGHRPLVISLR